MTTPTFEAFASAPQSRAKLERFARSISDMLRASSSRDNERNSRFDDIERTEGEALRHAKQAVDRRRIKDEADAQRARLARDRRDAEARLAQALQAERAALDWAAMQNFAHSRAGRPESWPLKDVRRDPVLPPGASSPQQALAIYRRQIADLTSLRTELLQRPLAADDLKRMITDELAGQLGTPSIDTRPGVTEPAGIRVAVAGTRMSGDNMVGGGVAGVRLLIWALYPEIEARLFAAVDGLDLTNPISELDLAYELDKLDREKLELERIEEAIIEDAEREGVAIARRPDADPRAVIGVEEVE